MAGRKSKTITISDHGSRDRGKVFLITELPASLAEDWALRAIRLAQRAGADVPEGIQGGMAGIAAVGILTVLSGADDVDQLRPLLSEMMDCVQIVTDPKTGFARKLVQDGVNEDIEEIRTRIMLRKEWLNVHLDFSIADALSELIEKKPSAVS